MLKLNDYRRIRGKTNVATARREKSHNIYDQTFSEDIGYRYCYIYDYDHDDQKNVDKGMTYKHTSKTGVDAKYYVTQYGSLSKDQVEYHIQFRRNQKPLSYYSESFGKNAEFPIGLYIDIPDEKDVYRRWLICSRDMEPDFVNYSVLPCNYNFHWVKNGKTFQMWGVARLQSSLKNSALCLETYIMNCFLIAGKSLESIDYNVWLKYQSVNV